MWEGAEGLEEPEVIADFQENMATTGKVHAWTHRDVKHAQWLLQRWRENHIFEEQVQAR